MLENLELVLLAFDEVVDGGYANLSETFDRQGHSRDGCAFDHESSADEGVLRRRLTVTMQGIDNDVPMSDMTISQVR